MRAILCILLLTAAVVLGQNNMWVLFNGGGGFPFWNMTKSNNNGSSGTEPCNVGMGCVTSHGSVGCSSDPSTGYEYLCNANYPTHPVNLRFCQWPAYQPGCMPEIPSCDCEGFPPQELGPGDPGLPGP